MLEPESVGVKISMPGVEEVTVESATASNGDGLFGENGDMNENRKEEDEKDGGNGNDVGCVEKGSSDAEEETEKNWPVEVVVEKSSPGERENNEESSAFTAEVEGTTGTVCFCFKSTIYTDQ